MNDHLQETLNYLFKVVGTDHLAFNTLTKILYLGDWKYALESQGKDALSHTIWKKHGNQPFSDELATSIQSNSCFSLEKPTPNERDWIVKFTSPIEESGLSKRKKDVINYVVNISKRTSADDVVSMTYPMFAYDEDTTINMPALAQDYLKNVRPNIKSSE